MSQFAKRLRYFRLERAMFQKDLAAIAGIKLRAYQLYEQGKTEPNIDVLIKFADVFEISLDELVGREFTPHFREAAFEERQINPPEHPNV